MGEEKQENGLGDMTKVLLGVLALGIIFIVIGFDTDTSGLIDTGVIFTTLALFAAAFLLKIDSYLRLGLAIAAGIILAGIVPSIWGFGVLPY